MKISEYWLREWINVKLDSASLFEQITMAGLEVIGSSNVCNKLHGVIIGEILECSKYSNTNNLYITKVNTGDNKPLNIISSATNCYQGLKVVVAKIGSIIVNNTVKELKFFEKISEGMLCSWLELGISDEYSNNIIELPIDAPIGVDIHDYLQLNDKIIEINIPLNRGDCFNIMGIAREISVLNNLTLNPLNIKSIPITNNLFFPIDVYEPYACPAYYNRIINNINIKATTPLWMKEKLRRCGIKSINSIIDITNYVMIELGQPIHVFDLNKINTKIIVRMAKEKESIILSNNTTIYLQSDTLVITDINNILAIAGICESKHSTINNTTKNIIFNCAYLNPIMINGRARRYNLQTESSCRYEHGIDPKLQNLALERITELALKICGGEVGPITAITNQLFMPTKNSIILHRKKLDNLIGYIIEENKVTNILTSIGCQVITYQDKWKIITPSWRFDITLEEDLIEEILRIYGYNNIPNISIKANLLINNDHKKNLSLIRVKNLLVDKGYQEVITYTFVDPRIQEYLHPNEKTLILRNPFSIDKSSMRLSLWSGLLSVISYNKNRQQNRMRIFESGLRFIPDEMSNLGVRQEFVLSGALTGNKYIEHWDITPRLIDFFDLKGDIESILDLTGKLDLIEFRTEENPALHPGQSAALYLKNICIGYIGMIHPALVTKFNINDKTAVFELLWNKISNFTFSKVNNVSRFPANRRDITILVDKNIPTIDIITECKKINITQLININLFDVYYGNGIPDGFKSLSLSLTLQDINRTLEDEEITLIVNRCIKTLEKRFHVTLRDETLWSLQKEKYKNDYLKKSN